MSKTTIPTAGLADSAVSTAKIADDAVTAAKATGLGITEVDSWRITGDINPTVSGSIQYIGGWERDDSTGFDKVGTGVSQSSGVFSFPSTGIWLVDFTMAHSSNADCYFGMVIENTTDGGSNYNRRVLSYTYNDYSNNTVGQVSNNSAIIDCTSTSLVKVRFGYNTNITGVTVRASTNENNTSARFIRLGDT